MFRRLGRPIHSPRVMDSIYLRIERLSIHRLTAGHILFISKRGGASENGRGAPRALRSRDSTTKSRAEIYDFTPFHKSTCAGVDPRIYARTRTRGRITTRTSARANGDGRASSARAESVSAGARSVLADLVFERFVAHASQLLRRSLDNVQGSRTLRIIEHRSKC
jgi:hypothetical protein